MGKPSPYLRKDTLVCTACGVTRAVTRACACRACLSDTAETHRAVAQCIVYVCCTGCGAVLWVKRLSCVLCDCLWMGRCGGPRGSTAASQPQGVDPPQSPHHPLGPTSWAPMQRESRTVRPISLAFRGSRGEGCQPPHARLLPY